ncbi:MAG: hypothetical protein WB507_01505 [Solirubrobacterales bacterium]
MNVSRSIQSIVLSALGLGICCLAICWVSASGAQADSSFSPTITAATASNRAGAFTFETVAITRQGEAEELGSITVQNPPGLLGMLSRVGVCSEVEAENGRCPESSKIGTVAVGLGPSFNPFYSEGPVYLTAPYGGAPFGLAVAVPLIAVPFDFGEVLVRGKLEIDPATASLRVESDPLPQSVDGIPLEIRTIRLDFHRKSFISNPTNCRPGSIQVTVTSASGVVAARQSRFQARECAKLEFKPRLSLRLRGKANRGAHPKLRATLALPRGNANLKTATITLPPAEEIDSAHLAAPCSQAAFAEGQVAGEHCPPDSVIGSARAKSPLLKGNLEGPIYLRSSGRRLPDLEVELDGQVGISLDARIASAHGGLRASFTNIPDAPLSKLTLNFKGGGDGLLVNGENSCRAPLRAIADFIGQNRAAAKQDPVLQGSCGKAGK